METFLYIYRINGEICTWMLYDRQPQTEFDALIQIDKIFYRGRSRDCIVIPIKTKQEEDMLTDFSLHARTEVGKAMGTLMKTMLTVGLRASHDKVTRFEFPDV